FFQAEDGIRDKLVTGVQTCALPISDNQIGDAGLVLKRDKDNAVGAARALADQDEPGNRDMAIDRQGGEVAGGDEAFLRELSAERSEERRVGKEGRSRWARGG